MRVTSLLELPDELLLCVVHSLDPWERQATLLKLSLVNRQLATFAGDELYSSLSIHPQRTHILIAHLLQKPKLATKVVELNVQCTGVDEARLLMWDQYDFRTKTVVFSPSEALLETRRRCMSILRKKGFTDDCIHWITGSGIDESFIYIAALLLHTPNVKYLTLGYQVASDMARPMGLHGDGRPRYAAHLLGQVFQRLKWLRIRPRKLRVWLERQHPTSRLQHPILQQQFEGYDGHLDALRERMRIPKAELEAENNGPVGLKARIVGKDDELRLDCLIIDGMISLRHLEIPSHSLFPRPSRTGKSEIMIFPPYIRSIGITACAWSIVPYLDQFLATERKKYTHLMRIEAVWSDFVVRKASEPSLETAQANLRRVIAAWKEYNIEMICTLMRGYAYGPTLRE
tara:strand:+ start:486 stop:1688 length:1203 start_codon:yes stop_codon:yes gene_type:complete